MGEGMLGPIGVDLSVWSWWSMAVPEASVVDREVFYSFNLVFCEAIGVGIEY